MLPDSASISVKKLDPCFCNAQLLKDPVWYRMGEMGMIISHFFFQFYAKWASKGWILGLCVRYKGYVAKNGGGGKDGFGWSFFAYEISSLGLHIELGGSTRPTLEKTNLELKKNICIKPFFINAIFRFPFRCQRDITCVWNITSCLKNPQEHLHVYKSKLW